VNNRLLELAQEAELSANLGNAIDIKLMMKNYAQLIIQECVDTIMNDTDRHRKEYFAGLLKEHFGSE
jgi:hypothetical protein